MINILINNLSLDEMAPFSVIELGIIATIIVLLFFHVVNRFLLRFKRNSAVAFILSILFHGSGYAYSAAYVRAWIYFVLLNSLLLATNHFSSDDETMRNIFALSYFIILFIHASKSGTYASKSDRIMRQNMVKKNQQKMEENYTHSLLSYINQGYHLALDTNFLMHFNGLLENIFKNTNASIYLHPTVFGELEGLKKSKARNVRIAAQLGFDILELYQTHQRLEWTRRPRNSQNFSSADQRIVSGVLHEIQMGTPLVFVSHDKGARIMARSLNIPVADPLEKNERLSG